MLRSLTGAAAMLASGFLFGGCRPVQETRGRTAAAPPAVPLPPCYLPTLGNPVAAGITSAGDAEAPPILLLHGNGNHSSLWLTAAWRFESNGWPRERIFALDFPYPVARDDDRVPQAYRSGTAEQRDQLATAIGTVRARTGADRVVLIGNSRGGNAIRNALKHGGAAPLVSHAILCGTPNHGAYYQPGDGNEFNGAGTFLRDLNAGSEIVPGVAFLTIRSDRNDLYAQPSGTGYASPALAGATNVVIPGIDHGETATGPAAFAAMHRFLTGRAPVAGIAPETSVELNGRITGLVGDIPTNLGVGGVTVRIYAVDPATGERRVAPLHERTTPADGVWGPFSTRPDDYHEFVVLAPGYAPQHIFRSPFPRSSPHVTFRLRNEIPEPGSGLIVFTRPRGYIATGRDIHSLDGEPVPDVRAGVPVEGSFTRPFAGAERAMPARLNDERLTIRARTAALTLAEFHY